MKIIEPLTDERPTEDAIRTFESTLGCSLPEPYRQFLIEKNGGRPHPSAFTFCTRTGERGDSLVDWFYTLSPDDAYNLYDNLQIYRGRIPEGLLPIACDPLGNQLLIGVKDKRGRVFFWDHELENSSKSIWDNVSFVARSFDEFINILS